MPPTRRILSAITLTLLLAAAPGAARDWFVDQNSQVPGPDGSPNRPYLTIQDALDDPFFLTGDRILVDPGTYVENLSIAGLEVHLESVEGPAVTTILGDGTAPVLMFSGAHGSSVTGFTVAGGSAEFGGGIELFASDNATVSRNVITGNTAVALVTIGVGGGIDSYASSYVRVLENLVVGNHADSRGGGIHLETCHSCEVSFNTVIGNTVGTGGSSYGAGIALWFGTGTGVVNNNVVTGNISDVIPPVEAGGIEFYSDTGTAQGNLLFGNVPADLVVQEVPVVLPDGSGNEAADPRYVDEAGGNYRLLVDSPGVETALMAPASSVDLDGNERPIDADGDSSAVTDRGAFENLGELASLLTVDLASLVSWAGEVPPAAAYHVYRSTPADLAVGDAGACQDGRDPNLLDTEFAEPDVPPLGGILTFLVTFERNGAESSPGKNSAAAARIPSTRCL